jgi:hypothetical protein
MFPAEMSLDKKEVSSLSTKQCPGLIAVCPPKPGSLGNDHGKQQAGNENETNVV